jgi:hypothetical protein
MRLLIILLLVLVASAAAQGTHQVTLTWSQSIGIIPPGNWKFWSTFGQGITKNCVYRSLVSGGPYVQLFCATPAFTTYTDSNVQSGSTYFYVVTAFAGTTESDYSNQITAVIPNN